MTARVGVGIALVLAAGCAPALRKEPTPVPAPAPGAAGRSAADLVAEANASFARRPDVDAVKRAESLYLAAASADEQATDGLYGAVLAKLWLADRERSAPARAALAESAVAAGQWCVKRAPESPACAYALAQAVGIEVREHHSKARKGLKAMVDELHRAQKGDPRLDHAGPSRVLALLLVRAPGWPIGPGDPESGLAEARQAVALFPDYPPNQLALAEALGATGAPGEARAAATRAVSLARATTDDPDAPEWVEEGEALLKKLGGTPPRLG